MSKLSISDIVALAKAGFTPKDVKEILAQDVPSDDDQGANNQNSNSEPDEPANDEPENPANATGNVQNSEGHTDASDIDYKQKFEDAQKLIERLQADNASRNAAGHEDTSAADKLTDSFRRIMS